MRSKEAIIIGIVIVASMAILAVLYAYQQGQKITINKTLETADGIKITLDEVALRPIDSQQTDIIIKGKISNTTDRNLALTNVPDMPEDYSACLRYYNKIERTDLPIPTFEELSSDCKTYIKYLDDKDNEQVELLTPQNSTAKTDFSRIGGSQDLVEILNSEYRSLNPHESITGIMVFSTQEEEKGMYTFKYKNQQVNFEIN